jgi:biotin carboxyl carrier protein
MLTVTFPSGKSLEVESGKEGILVGNRLFEGNIARLHDRNYHILYQNRSYTVEVLDVEAENKNFRFRINGRLYDLKVSSELDRLLEKMGIQNTQSAQPAQVKAPMPGLILEVKITEGQEVQKGDTLLILEAMKMENLLKAPATGIIRTLKVKPGDRVEKNQMLILFGN